MNSDNKIFNYIIHCLEFNLFFNMYLTTKHHFIHVGKSITYTCSHQRRSKLIYVNRNEY